MDAKLLSFACNIGHVLMLYISCVLSLYLCRLSEQGERNHEGNVALLPAATPQRAWKSAGLFLDVGGNAGQRTRHETVPVQNFALPAVDGIMLW